MHTRVPEQAGLGRSLSGEEGGVLELYPELGALRDAAFLFKARLHSDA